MKTPNRGNPMRALYNWMDNSTLLQCIRSGLVMTIPVLLIGSFALVLRSLPIPAYQEFITGFLSGTLYTIFNAIHSATFGFMALYMTASISICYSQQRMDSQQFHYGPLFTSIICFCILSVFLSENFSLEAFGVKGMFTAIICALGASALYCWLSRRLTGHVRLYADGADVEFNSAISTIIPAILVILVFAVLNLCLVKLFGVHSTQMLFVNLINGFFSNMGRSLGSMLLFVLLSNVLWFFGIHGTDVLESVTQHLFVPAVALNAGNIAAGGQATEIFSKTFFDVFVAMGGCGTSVCLLIAVLLFSRRRSNRNLSRFAALPMLFNINEPMVFGLPIVFNPVLFIPFVLTPLMTVFTSWAAMALGLVPIPAVTVEWTTPVLLGGYLATGSISGAILQLVNIVLGVLIYRPFVRLYDKEKLRNANWRMEKLIRILQKSEAERRPVELLALRDSTSTVSKALAEDLRFHLARELPKLYYQPQFDSQGACIGAEALLRWEHPLYGMVYPPLMIQIAEESGMLTALEESVFRRVLKDMEPLLDVLGREAKISVNVTGTTIQTAKFERFLSEMHQRYPKYTRNLCIEITEQAAIHLDQDLLERLMRIHGLGYCFAIDDFSMGNTSIKYLQTNVFDCIKLDGSLSRNVLSNPRSLEIVASIAELAASFGIRVLAEFVETSQQREILEGAGCRLYQGYLYSPAVPLDSLREALPGSKQAD